MSKGIMWEFGLEFLEVGGDVHVAELLFGFFDVCEDAAVDEETDDGGHDKEQEREDDEDLDEFSGFAHVLLRGGWILI